MRIVMPSELHEFVLRTPFVCVSVRCAEADLRARAEALFASYPRDTATITEAQPECVRIALERAGDGAAVRVKCPGAAPVPCDREYSEDDALARLEGEFYRVVLAAAHAQGWTPVHAAALAFGEHGVLLLGESGAGKSTLALEWLRCHSDAHYLSDDVVFLDAANGLNVVGLPRLVGFEHPWPTATHPLPETFALSQWKASGRAQRTVLTRHAVAVAPSRVRNAPVRLAAAVLPRYEPARLGSAEEAVLEPLLPREATAAVWQAVLHEPSATASEFERVAALVRQATVTYRLRSATRESARRALASLLPALTT